MVDELCFDLKQETVLTMDGGFLRSNNKHLKIIKVKPP